MNKPIKIYL